MIQIDSLIAFYTQKLLSAKILYSDSQNLYHSKKKDYESKFLSRIFRFKFENSFKFYEVLHQWYSEKNVEIIDDKLKVLFYLKKQGNTSADWVYDNMEYYKYCIELEGPQK